MITNATGTAAHEAFFEQRFATGKVPYGFAIRFSIGYYTLIRL
jgi:hypothetical protein